jgi:hypothetical protein
MPRAETRRPNGQSALLPKSAFPLQEGPVGGCVGGGGARGASCYQRHC